MNTRTLTFETPAYLTSYYGPEDLTTERAAQALSFYGFSSTPEGYTLVGRAKITVEIVDDKQIVANKVDSLKAEKARVLAEAGLKANQLEQNIQSLLAIAFDESVA